MGDVAIALLTIWLSEVFFFDSQTPAKLTLKLPFCFFVSFKALSK